HNFVLALLHLRQIDMRAVNYNAVLGGFLFDKNEMIGRSQQRFARDAAHVEASATKVLVLFDQRSFQTELTGANRSNITARSRTDDNSIKFFHISLCHSYRKYCHSERSEESRSIFSGRFI